MLRKIAFSAGLVLLLLVVAVGIFLSGGPEFPADSNRIIDSEIAAEPPELVTGTPGYAQSGDIKLWYEVINPAGKPRATVLLIMGAGTSSMLWPPEFMQSLVKTGYRVIRFDNRGTGMSDWLQDWNSDKPYTVEDMARDAIAVLDANGIDRAHVIGVSMGGMVGQRLAISHGERVLSLVSMSSSAHVFDPEFSHLRPDFGLESLRLILKYGLAGSEEGMIRMMAGFIGMMLNDKLTLDDMKSTAKLVLYEMRKRRGFNRYAQPQHFAAMKASGSRLEELAAIKCPVLVVHGTADPTLDIAHAKKFVSRLPRAQALWLEGAGHIIRERYMPEMMDAIFRFFASAQHKQTDSPGQ